MRVLVALLSAVVAGLALLPAGARASCAMRDARSVTAGADAAFVGTYVGRRGPHDVFAVERAVKGQLGPEVLVLAPAEGRPTSVDLRPTPGMRLGLALLGGPAGWTSNDCLRMDPDALLATGGRPCTTPAIASLRRLSAARAGRRVRFGVRIASAPDAAHVLRLAWGDGTSTTVGLAAGDAGAVLVHRYAAARRRVVRARVRTVPFGGCGAEALRSRARNLTVRVSRG